MGFAWVESSNVNATTQDPIAFQGAIAFNPSSTKAEIYAFYRPFSSISNKLISIRRFLKISNYSAWKLINHVIVTKNLNVKFHKVKSHSGDTFNDLSDDLANMARSLPPLEINPTRKSLPGNWYSLSDMLTTTGYEQPLGISSKKFGSHNDKLHIWERSNKISRKDKTKRTRKRRSKVTTRSTETRRTSSQTVINHDSRVSPNELHHRQHPFFIIPSEYNDNVLGSPIPLWQGDFFLGGGWMHTGVASATSYNNDICPPQ
ncbi:ribonuclease H-like domain-containing protein [Rhizophagus irregularis DAOM 181602=DAOM 197198]|nr:ribonuclease H-like domain-containing protein [Rhizophagus irregularis DAOM 181602=DAOM 197198]